jgi:hypothetical protein
VVSFEATESILIPLSWKDLRQTLQFAGALLDELFAVAGQLPDRGDRRWRDETAPQQPALGQLRQPHRVQRVTFAARDVLDMPRVDQQHLQWLLGLTQSVKDRLPINPRRFHRHMRHTFKGQPGHQLGQRLVKGVVLAHLLTALARSLTRRAHRHRDDLLANIDRGHPFIHDLHRGLPSQRPLRHAAHGTRMKIKSLRLALDTAATRSTQPGQAPASIFGPGSTHAKPQQRQRATPHQFHRPASAPPEA